MKKRAFYFSLFGLVMITVLLSGIGTARASGHIEVSTGWTYVQPGEENQDVGDITIVWSDPDADHPYDIAAYPDARMQVTVTLNNDGVVFSDNGTNEVTITLPGDEDPLPAAISGDELKVDVDEDATGSISANIRVYYFAGGQYRIDESFGDAIVEIDNADVIVEDAETQPVQPAQPTAVYVIGAPTFTVDGAVTPVVNPSYLKEGRTYLAIRDIAAGLGISDADIKWDPATREVTLTKGSKIVKVQIGSYIIKVNGIPDVMDVAPEMNNNRTMLPASFIAKAFGAAASWDALTKTVTIK